MPRNDPLRNFRYRLEIDGLQQAGFSEVSIAEIATSPIDYREGNEDPWVRKLDGLTAFGNITLKWGITDSKDLADWHRQVVEGDIANARKTVAIIVQNEAGEDKSRFEIVEAWPCKYDPSDLNATGNEVAIDTLELCNEGVKRVQ